MMSSNVRSHISRLVCKALAADKNSVTKQAALKSIITTDFEEGNFFLKIQEKSVSSIFGVTAGHPILKLELDHVIQKIERRECLGVIYYLFSLNKNLFINEVLDAKQEPLPSTNCKMDETVIVEYSSPNVAKPFHMGHLRSTVVGQFVANVLSNSYNVIRLNYLGDWGTQFGLVQAGLEKMSLDLNNLKDNPLKVINEAYILANKDKKLLDHAKEISLALEKKSDGKELDIWKKLRELTIKHLKETYHVLGIHFDEYSWESQYATGCGPIIDKLRGDGIIEDIDGQLVVPRGQRKIPLMKSDGTSLYLSRDILAAVDRFNRHNCKSVKYVIDKSQEDHIDALRHIVSAYIGKDIVDHVKFGRVIGMSTRKGTSIFLSDILDKATQLMADQQEKSINTRDQHFETTQALAVSTLIIYLLKQRRTKDFTFNWETALQGKGDTGVKLQYTHSRLCSLEKKCGVEIPLDCHPQLITESEALKLIALLHRYEQIMMHSEADLESSYLVNYLFKLCNSVSLCLKKLPIKGENTELAQQRLLLFHKAKSVIKSSMLVLGLKPLDRM